MHKRPKVPVSARIAPTAQLLDKAVDTASRIASFSRASVLMAKERFTRAFKSTLLEELRFESRLSQALFAT